MSKRVNVELTASIEVQVSHKTDIDYDEFKDWYEEDGSTLTTVEPDDVIEFIRSSPDYEIDVQASFPKPNVDVHDVLDFTIEEAEVLS